MLTFHPFPGKPVECDGCGSLIAAGQSCLTWVTHNYCREECVRQAADHYRGVADSLERGLADMRRMNR